jgi:hypothetical protein
LNPASCADSDGLSLSEREIRFNDHATIQGLPLDGTRGKTKPWMVWRCTHQCSKFVPLPDYVNGKPVKPYQLKCHDARYFDDGYTCGSQGRYREAR